MSLPENHMQQGVVITEAPVKAEYENGHIFVRVTGKNGNYVGIQMGSDFETKDIQTVINFADAVYKMGFSDAGLVLMNMPKPVSEPPKFIGVICKNIEDFLKWREDNKLILVPTGKLKDTRRKFAVDNTMYVCITRPFDCHGYTFDDLLFTDASYQNNNVHEIIEQIKPTMRVPDRFKKGVEKYGYDSDFVKGYQALMQQLRFGERDKYFDKWEV